MLALLLLPSFTPVHERLYKSSSLFFTGKTRRRLEMTEEEMHGFQAGRPTATERERTSVRLCMLTSCRMRTVQQRHTCTRVSD